MCVSDVETFRTFLRPNPVIVKKLFSVLLFKACKQIRKREENGKEKPSRGPNGVRTRKLPSAELRKLVLSLRRLISLPRQASWGGGWGPFGLETQIPQVAGGVEEGAASR